MEILLAEKIDYTDINIVLLDEVFVYPDEIQKLIDELWEKKMVESIINNMKIWDWDNYFLSRYEHIDGKLFLYIWITKFRNVSMLDFLPTEIRCNTWLVQPRWLFVAWIIKSVDDYFVFPRRNAKDVTKKIISNITTFWWVLQPNETNINTFDWVREHMKKEIVEEMWIEDRDIVWWNFIWLTISKALNRWIVFYVALSLSVKDIDIKFNHNSDQEMDELIYIYKDDLNDFFNKNWFNDSGSIVNNLWLYKCILRKVNLL